MIRYDARGHVTAYDDDSGAVLATVLDMGATCSVDALVTSLAPHQATEYAAAVAKWAARKRQQRGRVGQWD